jgi:hypothetical protein
MKGAGKTKSRRRRGGGRERPVLHASIEVIRTAVEDLLKEFL